LRPSTPGRELPEDRSDWVLEALSGTPGLRCAYHLQGRDGTRVSLSVWDDAEATQEGGRRIRAAREARGLESDPPDKEEFFEVVSEYRAPT
jgi:heme-degrading monooxygenase HmoA